MRALGPITKWWWYLVYKKCDKERTMRGTSSQRKQEEDSCQLQAAEMIGEGHNQKQKPEDRGVTRGHFGDSCLERSHISSWTFILHEKEQSLVWSVSCQGTAGAVAPLITFPRSSAAPVIRDRFLDCPLISSSSCLQVPCAITLTKCKRQALKYRLINVIPWIVVNVANPPFHKIPGILLCLWGGGGDGGGGPGCLVLS